MGLNSLSQQEILERLSRLYEFRDLVVIGRRRGFLEQNEALRLVSLAKELVEELSRGEARFTLRLLDAIENIIHRPGPLLKSITIERFGREDVIPMPEILAESLPSSLPLISTLRLVVKGPIGELLIEKAAEKSGLDFRIVEALLNVTPEDLAHELGYLFESLLGVADSYARMLENYILRYGIEELKPKGNMLSVLAEVVGRAWLSIALKDRWIEAIPLPLSRVNRHEFDAIAIKVVEDRAEVYEAEVETRCRNFLAEEKASLTRIEGKVKRLKDLLNKIPSSYRLQGVKRACIAKLVLLCFDSPPSSLKEEILLRVREFLKRLNLSTFGKLLCPQFSLEKDVCLYIASDMLSKLGDSQPERRLKEAIKYIEGLLKHPQNK